MKRRHSLALTRSVLMLFIASFLLQNVSLMFGARATYAATLLSDNFTGTTIDTNLWTETDNGGVGGTTGNIQQNGSLSVTGGSVWGQNYLLSVLTFNRSLGDITLETDITCSSGASIPGIGYGDPGILTGGGDSYTLFIVSNAIHFSRQHANANAEDITTGVSCTNGVAFHAKIVVNQVSGAVLYLNNNVTAAATLSGGTFNNKSFFLEGHSGVTNIDNVVITGTSSLTVPDAPTSLVATPASTQMVLGWAAPAGNGGAAITDYLVEYKLSSEPTTWSTFADGVSTSTAATVTGLTNSLSYDFRVSATNSVGTGATSTVATATPELSAPTAPQSLVATGGSSAQVGLSWSAPLSNGGAAISDYVVQYKLSSEPSTWSTFADGTSTSTTATVTSLTNGLSYDFKVAGVNSVGTGAYSSTATATPNIFALSDTFTGTTIDTGKWNETDAGGIGGTSGSVQQNGSLSVAGTGSWSSQNGVSSVRTFDRTNGDVHIDFSVTRTSCGSGVGPVAMGYGDLNFTVVGSTSYILLSNATAWELYYWLNGTNQVNSPQTVSGLTSCTNGVPTTFRLSALQAGGAKVYVNGSGTAAATISGGTFTNESVWFGGLNVAGTVTYDDLAVTEPVTGPFPPTGLTPVVGDAQIGLSWIAGDSNGSDITDYIVQYKTVAAGSWSTFADGTSTSTTATVTGLTNGVNYNFRVSAVNGNGTSLPSSTATARPLSATPTAPTATGVTITGTASVGEVVTGSYTYTDINGDSEGTSLYRWLRADSAGGSYSAIPGATSVSYTIVLGDLTKYLKFEVTPVASVAPTNGSAVLSAASSAVDQVDYINQILSTGQSLSVGVASSPALSTTQPYSNVMLSGGSGGIGTGGTFTPLVESSVETMSSSMANTITANSANQSFDVAVGLHGVSGYTYSQLKKGTGPYSNGMTQVTNTKSAAISLGRVSRVIGVTTIHGETDNFNGVSGPTYQGYLEEWQNDYDTDVKAITGQTSTVPLYLDQMSSYFSSYANTPTSQIPIHQLAAAEENPGKIYMVTPKYFFNYSDRHHLTAASSRWLGEYYGKVIKKVTIDHEAWRPLTPDTVVRNANVIYANFHVPSGVLAFDTTIEQAKTNMGFEYYDTTASATISSVEILDSDTVKVTLSGTPTGANQRLRYAYTGTAGVDAGSHSAGAAGGNLRDTDAYPSAYGNTLYNWAVHFDEAITADSGAPTITSVSSTVDNASYTVGAVIDANVTFSEAVTSTGSVTLTFETGATDRTCSFTVTNNTTASCTYTVQAGDTTSDLTVSSIVGTIADQVANPMVDFVPATNLAANKNIVIDTTAPDASISYSTTAPTNGNVTATLVAGETLVVTNNSGNPAYVFSANGSFQFTFTDTLGNAAALTATVANIDTGAPTITIGSYPTAPTNADIAVTASTNEGTLNASSHVFTANGSFVFTATDAAGNSSSQTVTITNIDKTAPVVTIAPYTTAPTRLDVTVTASTNEGTLNASSHVFTANGSFVFTATDAAGNTGSQTVTITNIDKSKPVNKTISLSKGAYGYKYNGVSKTIKPFGSDYKGKIWARSFTFGPDGKVFLFLNSGAYKNGQIKLYSEAGKLIKAYNPYGGNAKNGLNATVVVESNGKVYLAVSDAKSATAVKTYQVTPTGLKSLTSINAAPKAGTILIGFQKLYSTQYGLVTKKSTDAKSLKVWKLNLSNNKFTEDTKINKKKIKI